MERIAGLVVERVAARLHEERGIELDRRRRRSSPGSRRTGFDEQFGARPLHRHVRRTLEKELTRAILAGELPDGARVEATGDGDGIALRVAATAATVA